MGPTSLTTHKECPPDIATTHTNSYPFASGHDGKGRKFLRRRGFRGGQLVIVANTTPTKFFAEVVCRNSNL
jgi:hypothetical protein